MNRKGLQDSTLVGSTRENPELDLLAVLHLDNQLCIFSYVMKNSCRAGWMGFGKKANLLHLATLVCMLKIFQLLSLGQGRKGPKCFFRLFFSLGFCSHQFQPIPVIV